MSIFQRAHALRIGKGLAPRFQQLRRPEKASYMLCTN
jgi:hypothetical protein